MEQQTKFKIGDRVIINSDRELNLGLVPNGENKLVKKRLNGKIMYESSPIYTEKKVYVSGERGTICGLETPLFSVIFDNGIGCFVFRKHEIVLINIKNNGWDEETL